MRSLSFPQVHPGGWVGKARAGPPSSPLGWMGGCLGAVRAQIAAVMGRKGVCAEWAEMGCVPRLLLPASSLRGTSMPPHHPSSQSPPKDTPSFHVCAQALSRVRLCATPWAVARQAPLSVGFPRQENWSGLPFPSLGELPDPGMEPTSPASPALAGGFFTHRGTWEAHHPTGCPKTSSGSRSPCHAILLDVMQEQGK